MAKTKVSDWDTTAANNTDVGDVSITGASSIRLGNDAIQEMMAQIAKVDGGTDAVSDTWAFADPADDTKRVRLDAGNVTAGQTRVLSLPDADVSISAFAATLLDDASKISALATLGAVFGQCMLTLDSGSLKLIPYNGNLITDGLGNVLTVPAGLTLAATGLTPGTLYYIYAKRVSLTLDSLVADTTVPLRTSNGVWIKTGASDHMLVGAAIPDTGPAWVNSDTKRYVRSWFNEPPLRLYANLGSNTSVGNSTFSKISTNLDCNAALFEGERILATMTGYMWGSGSAATTGAGIGIDTSTAPQAFTEETPGAASQSMSFGVTAVSDSLSAGSHIITGCGRTTGTSVFSSATAVHGLILPRRG